jgi:guanylate kinase
MRAHEAYPFLVVNDVFDTALSELKAIVQAERLRRPRQQARLGDRLPPLLGA